MGSAENIADDSKYVGEERYTQKLTSLDKKNPEIS